MSQMQEIKCHMGAFLPEDSVFSTGLAQSSATLNMNAHDLIPKVSTFPPIILKTKDC